MTPEERIAELECEVAYLKEELGQMRHAGRLATITSRAGISRSMAAIVLALYDVAGRPMTNIQIYEITREFGTKDDVDLRILGVHVCGIRKAIGADCIETIHGYGYRLSKGGRERIEEFLA